MRSSALYWPLRRSVKELFSDGDACRFTRMKNTANIATIVRESNQEEIRAMVITLNSGDIISPMVDAARKKDKKAAEVVSEETKSGTASSRVESMAASLASVPFSILTTIASDKHLVNLFLQED